VFVWFYSSLLFIIYVLSFCPRSIGDVTRLCGMIVHDRCLSQNDRVNPSIYRIDATIHFDGFVGIMQTILDTFAKLCVEQTAES